MLSITRIKVLCHVIEMQFTLQKLLNKLKQGNDDDDDDFHIVSGDEYYTGGRRTLSGSSRDAADYDDVISYQRQVARLTGELEMAEEEKERWKSMVEKTKVNCLYILITNFSRSYDGKSCIA